MHYSAKQAHADTDPPYGRIGPVDVVHPAAEPDAQKAAKLVREEHNTKKRAHVANTVDVGDQAGCKRHCGQPE